MSRRSRGPGSWTARPSSAPPSTCRGRMAPDALAAAWRDGAAGRGRLRRPRDAGRGARPAPSPTGAARWSWRARCTSSARCAPGWSTTRCCAIRWPRDGRRRRSRSALPESAASCPAPRSGGGAATPSFALPADAGSGLPGAPRPLAIGPPTFDWGERTFVMGVLNVTPDSFSGDGLLAAADPGRGRGRAGAPRWSATARTSSTSAAPRAARAMPAVAGGGDRAGRPGDPRRRRRAARDAVLDRHDEPGRRRRGPRRRRPPAQRHLGRGRGHGDGPPGGRARRPDRAHAQPRRGALSQPRRGDRRGPPARDRPRARRRRRRGSTSSWTRGSASARRRTTTSRCWATCGARAARPPGPARDVAQVHAGQAARPAARRARRGDGRDDRARHRGRRGHRPRPRRARERPGRPGRGRRRARLAPGRLGEATE